MNIKMNDFNDTMKESYIKAEKMYKQYEEGKKYRDKINARENAQKDLKPKNRPCSLCHEGVLESYYINEDGRMEGVCVKCAMTHVLVTHCELNGRCIKCNGLIDVLSSNGAATSNGTGRMLRGTEEMQCVECKNVYIADTNLTLENYKNRLPFIDKKAFDRRLNVPGSEDFNVFMFSLRWIALMCRNSVGGKSIRSVAQQSFEKAKTKCMTKKEVEKATVIVFEIWMHGNEVMEWYDNFANKDILCV